MQSIWNEFLDLVKNEVGNQIVDTWFKSATLLDWDRDNNTLEIGVPNQFVNSWIKRNYMHLFKKHFLKLTRQDIVNLKFKICPKQTPLNLNLKNEALAASSTTISNNMEPTTLPLLNLTRKKPFYSEKKSTRNITLNKKYSFKNFIVGPNNHFAYSAAQAIASGKETKYNPLFIYGKSGLGKTHLLHCIGNEFLNNRKDSRVIYKTSDSFIEEFIKSIKQDKMLAFKERYSKVDLLLIDDVQFFSKKEQTQEIFFNIFNKIHEKKNQIILSSDTPPNEITGLHERLRSRFGWGLITDVTIPSLETKIAIVSKKSEELGIEIEKSVTEYIASKIDGNIRYLESMLTKLSAITTLSAQPINMELAKKELEKNGIKSSKPKFNTQTIINEISQVFKIKNQDFKSSKRSDNIVQARQVGAYFLKKYTAESLRSIGDMIGGRSHSTVIYSINQTENKIQNDEYFANKISEIEQNF